MITITDTSLDSPSAIKAFLVGSRNLKLSIPKSERYAWTARILKQTRYYSLRKRDKSTIREYIQTVTGYSRATVTRYIGAYKKHRWIGRKRSCRHRFPKKYTREDIQLLIKTDKAHSTLNGAATKKLFERAYKVYKDEAYKQLSMISVAHIYNLKKCICC